MRTRKLLATTALTMMCTWPLLAAAQDSGGGFTLEQAPPEQKPEVVRTSSVEIGMGWLSTDSFKFGEYTGLTDRGLFGIGNVDVYRHPPYDGDSTRYWELTGRNLGLTSRSIRGEFGQQGTFKLFGEFDQIPHYRLDDAQTPFLGVHNKTLSLPPGWVPGSDTSDFAALNQSLHDVQIKTQRTRVGGGFSWNLGDRLALTAKYRHEEKDGLETIAGIFGSTGGNPRSAILPEPIDYSTDEFDTTLNYSTDRLQAQLSYHLSLFNNNKDSLTWANPYTAHSQWDPSQDFNNGGQGRLALAPDNSAHQLALSAAYILSPTMRIAGNFSYGRMFQNDAFLPYTVNPTLSVPLALPRNSLEGDVTTMHGNLIFTARPTRKSDLKLAYTFDNRDDNTPRDVFVIVHNDSLDQAAGGTASADALINRPYSRMSHKLEIDGGYRILPSTKLGLGYEFETINRDFTEVRNTYEHTGKISLRSSPVSFASGWLEYDFSTRYGSKYVSNEPFLVAHTAAFIADESGGDPNSPSLFENNPYVRKFYIADRRRHTVKGGFTAMPTDKLTLGLSGLFDVSDYYNTEIGLTDMSLGSVTADVSYLPTDRITLTGFFTYDRAQYKQTGFARRNVPIVPGDDLSTISGDFWQADTTDNGFTVGAGVEWQAIKDKLKFTADYAFSRVITSIDLHSPTLNPQSLPDLNSDLHSFGLTGEYKIKDNLSAKLGYRFEYYNVDDFALDGVNQQIPLVLSLGNGSPNYTAHMVWASVELKF